MVVFESTEINMQIAKYFGADKIDELKSYLYQLIADDKISSLINSGLDLIKYCMTIVRNQASNKFAEFKKESSIERTYIKNDEMIEDIGVSDNNEDYIYNKYLSDYIMSEVDQLDEHSKLLFKLKHIYDYNVTNLSNQTTIHHSHITKNLQKTYDLLKSKIEQNILKNDINY